MGRIIDISEYTYENGDMRVIDILDVGDAAYRDGIKFNMAYLQRDPNTGHLSRLFGIDNSHGPSHIHYKNREEEVDLDWKAAMERFTGMIQEHRRREGWLK